MLAEVRSDQITEWIAFYKMDADEQKAALDKKDDKPDSGYELK